MSADGNPPAADRDDAAADGPAALRRLLSRHSLGAKHLAEPGPDDAQLALLMAAARRAPDHAGLAPYRFAAVRGAGRQALAALFEAAALDAGKPPEAAALDAERGARAPLTLAVIARIDHGHPLVPAHEQWIALGGALTNLLNAAHALGFAGKMLSGAKARQPRVVQAFCGPGETLVGWVALGTPQRVPRARASADAAPPPICSDWPGPGY
jgi:nitroreductase